MTQLINIKLSNNGVIVYDENQSSRGLYGDNIDQEMKDYISFIMPRLKYTYIICSYVRDLKPNEI